MTVRLLTWPIRVNTVVPLKAALRARASSNDYSLVKPSQTDRYLKIIVIVIKVGRVKKIEIWLTVFLSIFYRGLLTWPNKDDQKWPCKMTENAKDCKRFSTVLSKVKTCLQYSEIWKVIFGHTHTRCNIYSCHFLSNINKKIITFTVFSFGHLN